MIANETVELALLSSIHDMAGPAACGWLFMRDVLGWSAKDTAWSCCRTSVVAVNSRAVSRTNHPARRLSRSRRGEPARLPEVRAGRRACESGDGAAHRVPRDGAVDRRRAAPGRLDRRPGWTTTGADHVHPRQEERFEVLSGELGLRVDGVERVHVTGDAVVVPAGTRRMPPGTRATARCTSSSTSGPRSGPRSRSRRSPVSPRPARPSGSGVPRNPLRLALLLREFDDEIRFVRPSLRIQARSWDRSPRSASASDSGRPTCTRGPRETGPFSHDSTFAKEVILSDFTIADLHEIPARDQWICSRITISARSASTPTAPRRPGASDQQPQ